MCSPPQIYNDTMVTAVTKDMHYNQNKSFFFSLFILHRHANIQILYNISVDKLTVSGHQNLDKNTALVHTKNRAVGYATAFYFNNIKSRRKARR